MIGLTGVTTGNDVPMSLRTIYRIIESFERYGVRGDRREARAAPSCRDTSRTS